MTIISKDKLMTDPGDVFNSPQDILENTELNQDQKIVELKQWQDEIKQQLIAEEENMPGDPSNGELLRGIHDALDSLTGH